MADDADRAAEHIEKFEDAVLGKRGPYALPPGVEGDCELCGEWSGRLVGGACAPCRDRLTRLTGGVI